ncbi:MULTISPECIES: N-acetylornithine carbamoyltransferase [Chryseobacterium]|uniref:N-succinylornithine carbamoyltransferase n=1 Tax=Chryseobacterium camelliae TaxID=1265445 RepID=A0ABU0TFD3_9FLAO|nr:MULTISPECIES: N-acetylornithine carbamoyltransferase [Chryseobacterium]MDT3406434.1 N-succinyl-L-ornithine transcarbamylase [Pseudacidovorax intermedius]MDQ1095767.1 N-succinyl-L-ornithine transcarbamylase [Chryseobacterium camelliae]MDQ1099704.1 N-succinyl-L-ornithine transcarbamylase [Chryseobacterium sp. SORGH_AS_1048]MDR6087052.1 N-succinyl-L-ornithine transcarbamylase [Chryseobacterium sp. SORGH_AS_0909]MDR6131424.1 N-succinyl-L-ornithine transcarbamylase [Chryseobacterium sp. SORGH_AS
MKKFTGVSDVENLQEIIKKALQIKKDPLSETEKGKGKTIGLVFLNSSLRTRLSSQIAAQNLGLNVLTLNAAQEAWNLEFADGAIMNGDTVEHIKDAIEVLNQYCDIIAVRCFAGMKSKEDDVNESILSQFEKHAKVPVISLESATRHPLQSLADCITITENWTEERKPKVVLTWAPHIKPIAHAVGNSFAEWMQEMEVDFVIANPAGYDLDRNFTKDVEVIHDQEEALKDADFIYVKNWSSFDEYAAMPEVKDSWMLTNEKLSVTNNAKVMHCLPVRRNVELSDEVMDGKNSIIYEQAKNRIFSAQAVFSEILDGLDSQ